MLYHKKLWGQGGQKRCFGSKSTAFENFCCYLAAALLFAAFRGLLFPSTFILFHTLKDELVRWLTVTLKKQQRVQQDDRFCCLVFHLIISVDRVFDEWELVAWQDVFHLISVAAFMLTWILNVYTVLSQAVSAGIAGTWAGWPEVLLSEHFADTLLTCYFLLLL